jgi:hypothetical protein
MTTPRTRSFVSLAAALTVTLMLGGCASAGSGHTVDGTGDEPRPTIIFDNQAPDYVRVYLVSVRRQWLLGRVEAGARTTLEIPEAALATETGSMWVTVLPGGQPTGRVSGDPRAVTAVAEPVTRILSQRWTFAHGALEWLPLRGGEIPRP